jgi:hypothetical protein
MSKLFILKDYRTNEGDMQQFFVARVRRNHASRVYERGRRLKSYTVCGHPLYRAESRVCYG